MANAAGSVLVLVDFQKAFLSPAWGERNQPDAEANARRLLAHWRALRAPLVHVRHIGTIPTTLFAKGSEAVEFLPGLEPKAGETVFEKSVNSGFIGTGLEAHLRALGASTITLCGLTTPHCVSTTARMASNLGFEVTLAHDACAAFTATADMSWLPGTPAYDAQTAHRLAVAHLHGEFVSARTTAAILADMPAASA